jgi:hypothetical protein
MGLGQPSVTVSDRGGQFRGDRGAVSVSLRWIMVMSCPPWNGRLRVGVPAALARAGPADRGADPGDVSGQAGDTVAVQVQDRLGELFPDTEFAETFGQRRRPGWSPGTTPCAPASRAPRTRPLTPPFRAGHVTEG